MGIVGKVPHLSGCNNLRTVVLAGNWLTGEVPSFEDLPSLQRLCCYFPTSTSSTFILSNTHQHHFSFSLFSVSPDLDLSNNLFRGKFPQHLVNLIFKLRSYDLRRNGWGIESKSLLHDFVENNTTLRDKRVMDYEGQGLRWIEPPVRLTVCKIIAIFLFHLERTGVSSQRAYLLKSLS